MTRWVIMGICLFGASGCVSSPNAVSRAPSLNATEVGHFVGPGGSITIDLPSLRLDIGSQAYPLVDCSTERVRCFKNEDIGFHFITPRSCPTGPGTQGELAGGYRFQQIDMIEHGDSHQGRYVSTLGDRFSFGYFFDRGIIEIRYDPSGQLHFGGGTEGHSNMGVALPHTYRLPTNESFLGCRY